MNNPFKLLFLSVLFLLYLSRAVSADEVFVISTSNIIPYNTCIAGLRESLSTYSLQVVNIEGDLDKGKETVVKLQESPPRLLIAVGPQAAFLLSEARYPFPKLFCMVLNPQKLLGQEKLYPGVSLNIPTGFQLDTIKETFAGRKRIGILFSPQVNQPQINAFQQEALTRSLYIVPFPIASASDIPSILGSKEFLIDVLLMIPDEQINSKKIVEYIIKESLRRKIPVVGYNTWFAKNGAMLSFAIDYRDVGLQTGKLAMRMLQQTDSRASAMEAPQRIKISIDAKTAQKLGIALAPDMLQKADEVIR